MRVQDVMTRDAATVPAGASLKDAARPLVENGISGLPVVDGEADVLGKEDGAAGFVIGEAMTSPALTIDASRPPAEMSATWIRAEIERVLLEREALHDAGAGRAELEANRRRIVELERELAFALIAEHRRTA